jgi:hypothetical protein
VVATNVIDRMMRPIRRLIAAFSHIRSKPFAPLCRSDALVRCAVMALSLDLRLLLLPRKGD